VGGHPRLTHRVRSPHFLVLVVGLALFGCKRTPKQELPSPVEPPPPPADRLAPGQLIEGDVSIFGLQLPERTRVQAAFRESASTVGAYSPEDLAAYLKRRLDVSHVEIAGAKILFPRVRVRGNTTRLFRIEISPSPEGTELRLRDITPPTPIPGLTEEERWRKAGMKPNGELIDPQGLE
jgi:hypothetical protein